MSFAELMKQVNSMDYSCIVFDTAPTGHTLRLLSFPSVLEKAFDKLLQLKNKFSGLFQQVSNLAGATNPQQTEEKLYNKLESTKATIELINKQFKDPELTTFVCVCIPEFLSLFETERLVQELAKYEIDTHNIVVNQVLMPEQGSTCRKCSARCKMQSKYLSQIDMLYEDFSVIKLPLLDEEVRGQEAIKLFAKFLLKPQMARDMATKPHESSHNNTATSK
jgi:arsenite-transporting ATPase